MENKTLISVVTVSYNAVSSIEQTILSVINQTYPHIEYIIIDGGSTDGTVDIIKKYENKIAYWVSEPDKGIYDAMNKGVAVSKGDYIYFLGADDILLTPFSLLPQFCINHNIVYANVIFSHSGKRYLGKFSSIKLLTHNFPHQAMLYPKIVFNLYKYELKYSIYADYVLNLKCWKNNSIRFLYVPIDVALYNEMGKSAKSQDYSFIDDQIMLFVRCMPWYLFPYVLVRKALSYLLKRER